ncbi:hypothetical protein [uncultured Ruminococcus sp.]|uniref:hypothetical protein n=1 Tax=uncultured Ruminococcus sp. TaxID=165186 RepID=UPI00266D0AA7|nr:hypothetical protein [uncultured Ruminococcus sp.]
MGEHKLAIVLGIVTVVYILVMIFLFWRYRKAMGNLSEKLRECREKEEQQLEQEQVKAEEDITMIYQKPEATAPETEKTQPAPEEPTA